MPISCASFVQTPPSRPRASARGRAEGGLSRGWSVDRLSLLPCCQCPADRRSERCRARGQRGPACPEYLCAPEFGLSLSLLAIVPGEPFLREPYRETDLCPDRDGAPRARVSLCESRAHVLRSGAL